MLFMLPTLNQDAPAETLEQVIQLIQESRQNIGQNFFALGQALSFVKENRVYMAGGYDSFASFLRDKRVDIAAQDASRFMALTQDPAFERNLSMGLSKMLEVLKLPRNKRQQLLATGAEVNGQVKQIDEMNLKELKQASQELRREGKSRCDRCRRWVDSVKDLDGQFFGDGSGHACYELEMEERRALSAGGIPQAQMQNVLQTLKVETLPEDAPTEATTPLEWLPDSLYQLYGQILYEQQNDGGEVSRERLEQEREALKKFLHLCNKRMGEIQEMLQALDQLES